MQPIRINDISELDSHRLLQPIRQALPTNAKLHVVGGTIRDILSGRPILDLDLSSVLPPNEATTYFNKAGLRVIATGIEHGTVTIVVEGHNVELTTFRSPSTHSHEQFSRTIEEDLSGRDFTINAMAYDIGESILIDPYGGQQDLKQGLLRAVGNPMDRLTEDPLRLLRLVRFGPNAGRQVASNLWQAALVVAPTLKNIATERLRAELEKIIVGQHPDQSLLALLDLGLLQYLIPELMPAIGFEQNEYHIHDVFTHTLEVVRRTPAIKHIRLAALFHDIGKPHTLSVDENNRRHFYCHEHESGRVARQVLKRLTFSKNDQRQVGLLTEYHMRPLRCGPPAIRRLMRDLEDLLPDWLALKIADKSPTMPDDEFVAEVLLFFELWQEEIRRAKGAPYGKLAVNGHDLQEKIGIPPGPELGQLLRKLESLVIEDPSRNEQSTLLEYAHQLWGPLGTKQH